MSNLSNIVINTLIRIKNKILKIDSRTPLQMAIDNGLKIGSGHNIQWETMIDISHAWLIEIGDNVTIAPRCHILAHDASTKRMLGYTVIGKVKIGSNTFIGAGSIVLPGVSIGDNCVIGAGSIVRKDIPDGCVAAGNPAKVICTTREYLDKRKKQMEQGIIFDAQYHVDHISEDLKQSMRVSLEHGVGFVI